MRQLFRQSKLLWLNIVTILLVVVTGVLFLHVGALIYESESASQDRQELTENAMLFVNTSGNLTQWVRAYAATGDERYYSYYQDEVNTQKNREAALETMERIGISTEEQQLLEEMRAISNGLIPVEQLAMEIANANRDMALEYVFGRDYQEKYESIRALQADFLQAINQRTGDQANLIYLRQTRMEIAALICMAAIAVIQIWNALVVRFSLLRPIQQLRSEMSQMAAGNLATSAGVRSGKSELAALAKSLTETKSALRSYITDISTVLGAVSEGDITRRSAVQYKGDFLPIQQSLGRILDNLNEMITEIEMAAIQIAAGSQQMAAGSSTLSQGATEQATSVVQLSAMLEDISSRAADTASTARQTTDRAGHAGMELNVGHQSMNDMVEAMEGIEQNSNEINKVVHTISDIAFQTNLLALNAAVEAARAGEQGRGFAVVAEEVRNLANKCAQSVKETTVLVNKNLQVVSKGSEATRETARALEQVVAVSDEVIRAMAELADNAKSQSAAIAQVSMGMEQISMVVQANSATSEQSAAASQELSAQAQLLTDMVGRFRLQRQEVLPQILPATKDSLELHRGLGAARERPGQRRGASFAPNAPALDARMASGESAVPDKYRDVYL